MELEAFLEAHAAQSWQWGVIDCSIVLADWGLALGLPDLASRWRGIYQNEAEWRAIVKDHGGLLPLVEEACQRAGIAKRSIAKGCVGVIGGKLHPDLQWGAIHDGRRWLVRGTNGFQPVSVASPLGVWGI